jgi:hypothetical protein
MVIEIASIRFEIDFESDTVHFSPYLSQFVDRCKTGPGVVDCTIDFSKGALEFPNRKEATTINGISYQEISKSVFLFGLPRALFRVCLESHFAEVQCKDGRAIPGFTFVTILKLLASLLVLDKGGLALHCSAAFDHRNGYVFCGKSGSGKSTIAFGLRPRYTVLGDEFNALIPSGVAGYTCHGSPFTKPENVELCSPGCALVTTLFLLSPGAEASFADSGSVARSLLPVILDNVFTFPTSDEYAGKLFENTAALIRAVPIEVITDRDCLVSRLQRKELNNEI